MKRNSSPYCHTGKTPNPSFFWVARHLSGIHEKALRWISDYMILKSKITLGFRSLAGMTMGGHFHGLHIQEKKATYTQRISRIRVGARVASPMSVVSYVTEGKSRWATQPELERRRVYGA